MPIEEIKDAINVFEVVARTNEIIRAINVQLDKELDAVLAQGSIYIGNASSVPVGQTITGDISITEAGAVSISADVNLPGNPTTTTQASMDNSTRIASTAYVDAAVAGGGEFSKTDATAAPTANDDSADTSGNGSFAVNSHWVDVTTVLMPHLLLPYG
jgi:hypothetical protein